MKEIKIGTEVYPLPESWAEVNLGMFIQLQDILEDSDLGKMRRFIKFIAVLSGIEEKLLGTVNINSLGKIDLDWVNKPIDKKIEKLITINGVEYGIMKDIQNITLGEYGDLEEYITEDTNKNLDYITSILMRPVVQKDDDTYMIEEYDYTTVKDRAMLFRENMRVSQLINVTSFFLNGGE